MLNVYFKQAQNAILRIYQANKLYTHIAILISVTIALLIYIQYYYVPSQRERRIINTLHPHIRSKAKRFLNALRNANIDYKVTSGFRTFKEQAELYAKGRSQPGQIVTKADAGESFHNYGLAIDVIPQNSSELYQLANIGKSFGFQWGGDWNNFVDTPHFELKIGNSWPELLKKWKAGKTRIDGYVKL